MLGSFFLGIFVFVGYGAYRALNSDGWDNSNVLNWLRLLSHVFIHPEDFGRMYYLPEGVEKELVRQGYDMEANRPFDYISNDEFADNFPNSRP